MCAIVGFTMAAEQLFEKRDRSDGAVNKAEPVVQPGRDSRAQREDGAVQALPDAARAKFEATFNVSLGEVRVHTGKYAATLAADVNALAFARGNDIYLGEGVNPADPKNERLLAHEIAHTVQQRGAAKGTGPLDVTKPGDNVEKEADAAADAAMKGEAATVTAAGESIARKDKDEKKEDEPEPVTAFQSAWFSATKFNLQKGGGLNVTIGNDSVRIQSPEIIASSTATVNLPKDKKMGSATVQVGPIQTVLSSKRTAVYRKPDNTEHRQTRTMGQIRDAAASSQVDAKTTKSLKADKNTFYGGNVDIKLHRENVGKEDRMKDPQGEAHTADLGVMSGDKPQAVEVVMLDQPSFSAPKKLADGSVLVGTEGSDEFNTSAGFKTSFGETFAKSPFGWRVSWNKKIDVEKPEDAAAKAKADKDPKNDAISQFDQKDAIIEDTDVFVVQLANIQSAEDAAVRPLEWLVNNLPKARQASPEAAGFMEQAIANRAVTIQVTPKKSADSDAGLTTNLNLNVTPSITKMGKTVPVSAKQGETKTITTTLGALASAGAFNLGSTVGIAINEWSSGTFSNTDYLGGTIELPIGSKEAGGTVSAGVGSYYVSVLVSNFSF